MKHPLNKMIKNRVYIIILKFWKLIIQNWLPPGCSAQLIWHLWLLVSFSWLAVSSLRRVGRSAPARGAARGGTTQGATWYNMDIWMKPIDTMNAPCQGALCISLDAHVSQVPGALFQSYLTPCNTVPYPAIPYHTIPYHTESYHTLSYHTLPYLTLLHHTITYLPIIFKKITTVQLDLHLLPRAKQNNIRRKNPFKDKNR